MQKKTYSASVSVSLYSGNERLFGVLLDNVCVDFFPFSRVDEILRLLYSGKGDLCVKYMINNAG